jgi:hypothetical protein
MSQTELGRLEFEVQAARARLADDLADLTSPTTFSDFKDDIKGETLKLKDQVVESVKTSVTSHLEQFVEDLKAKAVANPGAALAIGAGLAWRFVHRPPVATALIGAGLYSLLRTKPETRTPYMGLYDEDRYGIRSFGTEPLASQASDALATVKSKTQQWTADAGAAARQVAADVKDKSSAVAERVSDFVHEAKETTVEALGTASAAARRGSGAVTETLRDENVRDSILLGAAALAIAAAIGISYQRQTE